MSRAQPEPQANLRLFPGNSVGYLSGFCPVEAEKSAEEFSLQVSDSVKDIEQLQPVWSKWAHSLDTNVDYFMFKLRNDPEILRPYAITVYKAGVPHAMLLGQVRQRRVSTVVSFVNIPGPFVKMLEINKGGRIGRQSPAIDEVLALQLSKALKNREVDLLSFQRLPLDSELFRQIQKLPGLLVKERVPHIFNYSVLSLIDAEGKHPKVFSGKARREARRKVRNLDRSFPGQVSMKCFSQPTELDVGMCDVMRVAVTTWQYCLGQSLSDTAATREAFQFLAKKGWLRIYVLYIKNTPCSFLVGQLYNNTFYCSYAGYQPSHSHFSVGSVWAFRAFEDLALIGTRYVDLGEGGQENNRRLGCLKSDEGTVHVYAPTLRGVWLSAFVGSTQAVRLGGRRLESAMQLRRLSKIWRQHLSSNGNPKGFLKELTRKRRINTGTK